MSQQRIVYLADAQSIHTQRWVSYFAQCGYQVDLFSFLPADIPGVTVHYLDAGPVRFEGGNWRYLKHLPTLRRQIRQLQPALVHGHYVTSYGLLAALIGQRPLVLTAWGSDVLITPRNFVVARWLTIFALKRADLITCDANHVVEALAALGAAPERVRVINFGIDTRRFSPEAKDPGFKAALGIPSDSPVIISTRRLEPVYSVETLIRAVPQVLDRIPNAMLLVAGEGEQKAHLEQLARSLSVAAQVRFIGLIANHDLPRYLASADVYVSTSLSDAGIAASTAEAMACGLPVVVTDFGDNGQWVRDGEGGFLVPPNEPTVLAERIVGLLRNDEARHQAGITNRQTIQDKNDYYREMDRVGQLYQELIAQRRR